MANLGGLKVLLACHHVLAPAYELLEHRLFCLPVALHLCGEFFEKLGDTRDRAHRGNIAEECRSDEKM